MDEYTRKAAPGYSFPAADSKCWAGLGLDSDLREVAVPIPSPSMVAEMLVSGDAARLIELGLTVVVWSEAVDLAPALNTTSGPQLFTRAVWDNRAEQWRPEAPRAPVQVYWGAWAGWGGRVPKPEALLGVFDGEKPRGRAGTRTSPEDPSGGPVQAPLLSGPG